MTLQQMKDIAPADRSLIESVMPYTMTNPERIYHLIESIRYLERNAIEGAIVECGVWRGGSMMTCAKTLVDCGDCDRELHLYDTFEGMPPPDAMDRRFDGRSAREILDESPRSRDNYYWAIAPLNEVRANIAATGYPDGRVQYHRGKVEETIPREAPDKIALLRLDTDWYSSTRHELEHLYTRLVSGGVLIIDDYGWWQGARQATDEFFARQSRSPLLHRLDLDGRACIKP